MNTLDITGIDDRMASMETQAGATDGTRPAPEIGKVFDRAAPRYEQAGVQFYAPLGERLVAGLGLRPGQRVLDLGCGRGACTHPAAVAVGPTGSVTGLDASTEMLAAARREAARIGLENVSFVEGDAAAPRFPAQWFDAIVAGLVIFMLPDPAAALRAIRDLLRPGGVFGMSTFGVDDPKFFEVTAAVLPYLDGPMPPVPGRQGGALRTMDGVADLVRAAGFDQVRVADEHLDVAFDGPHQWWDWLWQTGGRVVLERIADERLPEARAAAFERMEKVRAERGRFVIHWNVWNTYGTRGGGE
jgi:ubiquinone/menaquinone biosynthesis C-methylase UbiE